MHHHRIIPFLFAAIVASTAACEYKADLGDAKLQPGPPDAQDPVQPNAVPPSPYKLDVLFVVDNSGSMAEEQESLSQNLDALLQKLEQLPGGLPSVHIGVISTDVGAGAQAVGVPGCTVNGDNGRLARTAAPECPTDPYLADLVLADGTRQQNWDSGSLADAFKCINATDTLGCGFEQPLESMRRALSNVPPQNDDFLREDAHLAVIVLSDEDDCSAFDTLVFDTSEVAQDGPLGPASSFRCVEFGVACDGGDVARAEATYQDCQPKTSPFLTHPDEFVQYLTDLKGGDASKIIVSIIAGDRGPLEVLANFQGTFAAQPTCESESGSATGAYRLGYFAEQFEQHLVTSICDPDLTDALSATGSAMAAALEGSDPPGKDPTDPPVAPELTGCAAGTGSSGASLLLLGIALVFLRRRRL